MLEIKYILELLLGILNTILTLPAWLLDSLLGKFLVPAMLIFICGCSSYEQGTNGPFQQANAQHSAEVEPNFITGSVRVKYFSNDDHRIVLRGVSYAKAPDGTLTMNLESLETTSDPIGVRGANVPQINATYNGITMWSDSFWTGFDKTLSNAINAATPSIQKWIDTNPKLAKNPNELDVAVGEIFKGALLSEIAKK